MGKFLGYTNKPVITAGGKFLKWGTQLVQDPNFILLIDTEQPGSIGNNTQFAYYAEGTYTVEYDGKIEEKTGAQTLQFDAPGVYQVKFRGGMTRFGMIYDVFNVYDPLKIMELQQWGTIEWLNMFLMFSGCQNMVGTYTDVPNTSNVTYMSYMFENASSFNHPLNFDTSNVMDMEAMFESASSFNQPLNFDTSNVTNMAYMFESALLFNQPLNFDTSSVTNMEAMFAGASLFNQDLSGWCVPLIGSPPDNFDVGATAWTLPNSRPIWGTCP